MLLEKEILNQTFSPREAGGFQCTSAHIKNS